MRPNSARCTPFNSARGASPHATAKNGNRVSSGHSCLPLLPKTAERSDSNGSPSARPHTSRPRCPYNGGIDSGVAAAGRESVDPSGSPQLGTAAASSPLQAQIQAIEELQAATRQLQAATAANTEAIALINESPPSQKTSSLAEPLPHTRTISSTAFATEPTSASGPMLDVRVKEVAHKSDSSYDEVSIRIANPVCVGVCSLVAIVLTFMAGYFFREHQAEAEKEMVSRAEERFTHPLVLYLTSYTSWLGDKLNVRVHDGMCEDGLLITGPIPTIGSSVTFLLFLLWSFLGVAVFADLFMVAIEQITSKEVVKTVVLPGGRTHKLRMLTWNATVANLTLMALGSSAPEILLSVIEVMSSGFYAGELGPATIVGSAAFNMLVISAVCVIAIPDGEGRLIKELWVFAITAVFSVAAYLWLLVILVLSTPDIVDLWEGVTTFFLFPLLVWLAYLADQGAFGCSGGENSALRDTKNKSSRTIEVRANDGVGAGTRAANKSKAYYRVNATREASGFKSTEVQEQGRELSLTQATNINLAALEAAMNSEFNFFVSSVTVSEEDKVANIVVLRTGNNGEFVNVKYRCSFAPGVVKSLIFEPLQTTANIIIELLPEDRVLRRDGAPIFDISLSNPSELAKVGKVSKCSVIAMHARSPGYLVLAEDSLSVAEGDRKVRIVVQRLGGAAGSISCTVNTRDGSAIAPNDYLALEDQMLVFSDGQVEKEVSVAIIYDDAAERDEWFHVIFSDATGGAHFSEDCDGGPDRAIATVTITGDMPEYSCSNPPNTCKEACAFLGANVHATNMVTFEWSMQFSEAFDFDRGSGWVKSVIFLLSLPWKLAIAFAPPPSLFGGWACFSCVLALIGALTALIGDLAAHFGCCMGLPPSITAITFVALGTSLPDTFASMSAAQNEKYADASICNVTGSNSVNVFLGLGLPWAIAAFYWSTVSSASETAVAWHERYVSESWYVRGMPVGFAVPAGDLGFSVGIFCICAIICLLTLVLRRAIIGFELGMAHQLPTAVFFVGLWLLYIGASVWHTLG